MRFARTIRKQKGLSLDDVAAATGIAKSSISRYEQGAGMTEANEESFARCLGVSVDLMRKNAEDAPGLAAAILRQQEDDGVPT